jgi:diguanylate cyclase (GGDEF)-like protein/PAS domain S-box-containing protein
MIQFTKARFVKRNFWQLISSGVAAVFLLFLFIKAQPVDSVMHNSLTSDLRELQTRDTELGEAVLQHHYQLFHNYDAVNAIMQRMLALSAALPQYQENGSLPDTPEVMRELSVLQRQVEQKAAALEEFKSNNAVTKTALIYLPRTVNFVLAQLHGTDTLQREKFENLLRNALLMTANQNSYAQEILTQDINEVDQIIPGLPQHVRASAELAVRHAKSILEYENGMPGLLAQLGSYGKDHVGAGLEQIYLGQYQLQQRTATNYRLLLFLAALLMLGYAIYAYYRMREREQQLRIAAAAFETHEGIMIYGPDRRILRVNRAFTRLTGYSAEEVIGQIPDILRSGLHDAKFFSDRWETLVREKYWQGEVWNRHKDGKVYPVWLTTSAVSDADGQVTHYVSVFTDITLRKEAEEQIHRLAFYDPLTKLPNRRLLMDRLHHAMASSIRTGDHGVILFIDLDNFKTLNDTKGHDVGDLLLIEVAQRLQACVRAGDTVARLGGDEFVVMLGNLSDDVEQAVTHAKMAGENIRESLSQPYLLLDFEHHSSCSIGISLFHAEDVSVDDLLKRADTAMYEAKAAGRNTLRFFDPDMQAVLEARVILESDLRHAINQKQFNLFYQIQVNADSLPIGAEALLRWMHPVRGMVLPSEFIPLAEKNGLILPIGQWVMETACAQIKAWAANPLTNEMQLAVNVSARQFYQPDFVEQVRVALYMAGADPARLKIELTESVILDNINDAIAKMYQLKEIGVSFSMDDFGTGYSSLAYLTQLPLDQLKIDQSFVNNIGTKSTDAVIVQTVIGMANILGMEVIAEGVATEAQRAFLEHAGCMAYQGHLFSIPVPSAEFGELLLRGFAQDRAGVYGSSPTAP